MSQSQDAAKPWQQEDDKTMHEKRINQLSFFQMWRDHNANYRKNPKIADTQKLAVITLKVEHDRFSLLE